MFNDLIPELELIFDQLCLCEQTGKCDAEFVCSVLHYKWKFMCISLITTESWRQPDPRIPEWWLAPVCASCERMDGCRGNDARGLVARADDGHQETWSTSCLPDPPSKSTVIFQRKLAVFLLVYTFTGLLKNTRQYLLSNGASIQQYHIFHSWTVALLIEIAVGIVLSSLEIIFSYFFRLEEQHSE